MEGMEEWKCEQLQVQWLYAGGSEQWGVAATRQPPVTRMLPQSQRKRARERPAEGSIHARNFTRQRRARTQ